MLQWWQCTTALRSMSSASSPLLPHDATPFVTSSFLWSSGATLGLFASSQIYPMVFNIFHPTVAAGMTLGAFGAHALKGRPRITADNVHAWDTATNYLVCLHLFCAIATDPFADCEWSWFAPCIPAPQVFFPPFRWMCYPMRRCGVLGQYHVSYFVQEVCSAVMEAQLTDRLTQATVPRPHNTARWYNYDFWVSRHGLFG